MNVSCKNVTVFRNDRDGKTWYNISDGSKQLDNTWVNKSWLVRFPKDKIPNDRSKIDFNGFMSYSEYNDKVYVTIQVMEWRFSGTSSNVTSNSNNEQMSINKQYNAKDEFEKEFGW